MEEAKRVKKILNKGDSIHKKQGTGMFSAFLIFMQSLISFYHLYKKKDHLFCESKVKC